MPEIFGEKATCSSCDKEHSFDPLMGYDCLVLIDGRERPNLTWVWCDELCFNAWLDSPGAKELFPTM